MTYASSAAAYTRPRSWFPQSYDYGASEDASVLRETFSHLKIHFTLAATWQLKEELLKTAFEALLETIAGPTQYEEGSQQTSENTIREATRLLEALPASIPQPDISTEPNGAIAFEWYRDKNNVFVISTNGTGSIEYAALLGFGNEVHGRVNFAGDFPMPLNSLLSIFLASAP